MASTEGPSLDSGFAPLLAQALAGDPAAERRLFELLDARIRSLARKKVWDAEAAQDIAQETLRTVFEKYRVAEFHHGFLPWVFTILHHKVGNHLKKARLAREIGGLSTTGEAGALEAAAVAADDPIAATDLYLAIERGMQALSAECREVIRLLLSGAERGEIHQALGGGNPGTLDSRISRCRRKLLDIIEDPNEKR